MSKNSIQENKSVAKFYLEDGIMPTRHGLSRAFNMLSPLDLIIPAGGRVRISLGVTCDRPLLVFQSSGMVSRNLYLDTSDLSVYDSDRPIVLNVTNTGPIDSYIDRGDILARAIVLDNSNVEVL